MKRRVQSGFAIAYVAAARSEVANDDYANFCISLRVYMYARILRTSLLDD